ncbi:sortase [Candidatus Saccharibacteria bacterium]|nr:MAG: sortase [Candidatus Saccharibacteria bacterium]
MTDSDSAAAKKSASSHNEPAVNLIRQKIDSMYDAEPSAKEEKAEVTHLDHPPSKHQAFMKDLTASGKSLAEIQTAWHNYYVALPDDEKHAVWQEFYAEHDKQKKTAEKPKATAIPEQDIAQNKYAGPSVHTVSSHADHVAKHPKKPVGTKTVAQVKEQLLSKAAGNASKKLKAKQHFQSLLFGVGMGSLVVLVLLFGFFNDRFIAPFITPSRSVSSTPILIDSNTAVGPEPKVIIPKINVEIPVVYDEPSIQEDAIQAALERGVVHYATTPDPGQKGNAVIFGHSSNNLLNQGKYKFAFVLLNRLENGDTFYLNKDGVRYAYRIFEKKIVSPTEIGVLGTTSKPDTATLITCDPPGTSTNRLVVIGEQISPDPTANKASTATNSNNQTTIIPSNAPSLWQRIKEFFS